MLCTQVIKPQVIKNNNNNTKSVLTQIYINTYLNIKHNIFEELVPSVSPLLKKKKKAHKARARWYRGPFCRFINRRVFKRYLNKQTKKERTEAIREREPAGTREEEQRSTAR